MDTKNKEKGNVVKASWPRLSPSLFWFLIPMRCVLKSSLRFRHHCPQWRSYGCELDLLGFLPPTTEIPNHLRVFDEELLHKLFNSSIGECLPSELPASVYNCAQRRKLPSCDFFHTCLNQVSLKKSVWFPTHLKRHCGQSDPRKRAMWSHGRKSAFEYAAQSWWP